MKGFFPPDVTVAIEPQGDIIEDTTGVLTGSWVGLQTADMIGGNLGAYAAPVGAVVTWVTGTILDGHRVKGRSFLVPLGGAAFDDTGSLESGTLASIRNAGTTLIAAEAGNFVVWHRPRAAAAATPTRPAVTARAGGHAVVTACIVPDKACVLRSRRD